MQTTIRLARSRAQTLIEYALVGVTLVLGLVAAVLLVRGQLETYYSAIANAFVGTW